MYVIYTPYILTYNIHFKKNRIKFTDAYYTPSIKINLQQVRKDKQGNLEFYTNEQEKRIRLIE